MIRAKRSHSFNVDVADDYIWPFNLISFYLNHWLCLSYESFHKSARCNNMQTLQIVHHFPFCSDQYCFIVLFIKPLTEIECDFDEMKKRLSSNWMPFGTIQMSTSVNRVDIDLVDFSILCIQIWKWICQKWRQINSNLDEIKEITRDFVSFFYLFGQIEILNELTYWQIDF